MIAQTTPDTHLPVGVVPVHAGRGFRTHLAQSLRAAMEALVLLMVAAAPWAYGSVHPGFEFVLSCGVGMLLVLWAACMLVDGKLTWTRCPVELCLAGLFLLGIWQLTPLSREFLAQISPGTAGLYEQLLPEKPELLPHALQVDVDVAPGSTLSLYPGATRADVMRLLAVFIVFSAVRINIASSSSLRRLYIVCLVNASALCMFALIQFASSDSKTVYWTYTSLGHVFGPFINRNHFAFYVNLCIGAGVGLVLSRDTGAWEKRNAGPSRASAWQALKPSWSAFAGRYLLDPVCMWIGAALAIMVASVVLCLSRGGFLALVAATLLCTGYRFFRTPHSLRVVGGLVVGALALALASWYGFGLVVTRLSTFWQGDALDNRLPLWERLLPMATDFPLWGTGYGTFIYVESMYRTDARETHVSFEHAHNEYLEVLTEAGAPALILAVLAIGLVYLLCARGIRYHEGRPKAGLLVGILFAFTTLVMHSFGEFGLHVPAITLLAAVLCAQACAAGRKPAVRTRGEGREGSTGLGEAQLRFWGLAPVGGAVAAITLGLVICASSWRVYRADRLQAAASMTAIGELAGLQQRIGYLRAATAQTPADAELHLQLAHAYAREFETARASLLQKQQAEIDVAVAAWAVGGIAFTPSVTGGIPVHLWNETRLAKGRVRGPAEQRLMDESLGPALQSLVRARDRCPLLFGPHLGLAEYAQALESGDPQDVYLARVKRVAPSDPSVWFTCGIQELATGERDAAWESWRRSLQLSDQYLPQVLAMSANFLSANECLEKVLPDRPEILVEAAFRFGPDVADIELRRPLLEKAVTLLGAAPGPPSGADLYAKARAYEGLGQVTEATKAYESLLAREPGKVEYRQDFARMLYAAGHLERARGELLVILGQKPGHGPARELLVAVAKEMARKR